MSKRRSLTAMTVMVIAAFVFSISLARPNASAAATWSSLCPPGSHWVSGSGLFGSGCVKDAPAPKPAPKPSTNQQQTQDQAMQGVAGSIKG